mgnify:CR=1 FL=1|tara:strand:- start:266 stop:958 length:693 start_codon:yes stop_codon:yes gene_type:complete
MSITIGLKQDGEEKEVVIPTEWKDMTLKYWCGMINIIKSHFDKAKLISNTNTDEVNHLEDYLDFSNKKLEEFQSIQLNKDLFGYMTGLDKESMSLVSLDKVNEVVSVLDVLIEEYNPKGIKSFEFENETYYFPADYLKKNTYGDYIEATQLDMYIESMKHGKFDVLPEQMAILCRKIDETYDDDIIPEKTEKFKNLSMDVIWEFGFFLTQQKAKLMKLSSMYSEIAVKEV